MKSLGRQTEVNTFARTSTTSPTATVEGVGEVEPRPLAHARWDWTTVRRVLVVRLRSIGDTVLATPSLHALRRFLPGARIDVLLEDWVAPLLEGSPDVDRVVTVRRRSKSSRLQVARRLRAENYDVVYNLHGGSTAALLTRATGARHRVGYADYSYASLHNHAAPPSSKLWGRQKTHSVEQQLALLGWTGVPVTDRRATGLAATHAAAGSAAAVRVPQVVVFGSSNVAHWRPWSQVAAEVVREEMPCAPCPGYTCSEFDAPECIRRVTVERVTASVERVLEKSRGSSGVD